MKKDLRISVTKRLIKEALMGLLKTKPLNKIRISELCEASGVNRATFYRHYEKLQDVLREIETDFIREILPPNRPAKDMEEAYKNIETVCTYIYEHSEMVKILFLNITDTDMLDGLHTFYKEFLELEQKELLLQKLDEDTAQIILAMLGGGCQCLIRKWILDDIHKTPGEIAKILCNVIRWPGSSDFFLEEYAQLK